MAAQKPVIFLAFANEKESESRYLRGLAKEQTLIREALEPAVEAGLCEVIVESNATVNSILSTFQKSRFKDRIAIFHYGGHADGYQLLLESLEGKNVVAHGGGLVSFLSGQQGLQLIFLNGCSTQQQAMELVEAGVPAVIGTSHSIADNVATQLAIRFYGSIANGAPINRAWKEAEDEVKIIQGAGNTRSLYFDEPEEVPDFFPWDLYMRDGAEIIKDWNLPEAVDNPLFGLPDLPAAHLPDRPFRFLQRYTREHAEIFFGRSYYIRDMYDRTTDKTAAPVILFYGQSGVGKSSMLDAGLLPRLEQVCEVVYIRRDPMRGLTYTFHEALKIAAGNVIQAARGDLPAEEEVKKEAKDFVAQFTRIKEIAGELDDMSRKEIEKTLGKIQRKQAEAQEMEKQGKDPHAIDALEDIEGLPAREIWKLIEAGGGRPLVILLDQVEEVYTQPNPNLPNELDEVLEVIKGVFQDPKEMPKGKLILSYRKEYNPEIEEHLKKLQIPREGVFLKSLSKKDLVEVISGLTRTDRLKNKYRLNIDNDLPGLIADDLLDDRDSPIAPVLQILLTKLWNMTEQDDARNFTVKMYQHLRREGLLMGDFLDQQLEEVHQWRPEVTESGMALNLLYDHTTAMGTAGSRNLDEIKERYAHRSEDLESLIAKFQDLYLLAGAGYNRTALAHDTLAPLVQNKFKNSDQPGQRAARILENKVTEFMTDENTTLDETDLGIVESGLMGMPLWGQNEEKLIEASRERRAKNRRIRRRVRIAAVAAVALIVVAGFGAWISKLAADKAKLEAIAAKEKAEAERLRAEKEKERAEAERLRAEEEKRLADIARDKAKVEEAKAIAARKRAEEEALRANNNEKKAQENLALALKREKEAIEERERADANAERAEREFRIAQERLYRSTAKSLATKSIEMDEDTLKAILAAQAYMFNTQHEGDAFDPDIYESMYQAIKNVKGEPNVLPSSHTDAVRALGFSGDRMYSTSSDGTLLTWDWNSQTVASRTNLNNVMSRNLAISPEGDLYLASSDQNAIVLGQEPGGGNNKVSMHDGEVWDLSYIPGRKGFVSSGADKKIQYFNGDSIVTIATVNADVKALSANSRYIAGADEAGALTFWDMDNNYEAKQIFKTGASLSSVAFSKDGKVLAFGDNQGKVYIWDVAAGKLRRSFSGHEAPIYDLAFNNSGTQLASGSRDRSVRIWNLRAGQDINLPMVFQDNNGWVMSVAFTNDDSYVVAGTNKGTIKKWPTRPSMMRDELCSLVARDMTQDEWDQYVGENLKREPDHNLITDCN